MGQLSRRTITRCLGCWLNQTSTVCVGSNENTLYFWEKKKKESVWLSVWSSHVPFVLGRRHSLISLGTCSSAGQSMMRQQSRLVQVQGWQMQKSVLCCPHCFQHSLRVFVGVVWAHDLLGLGRQQLVQCQSWQRWVGLCWCVAPAAMGADACPTGNMLSWQYATLKRNNCLIWMAENHGKRTVLGWLGTPGASSHW